MDDLCHNNSKDGAPDVTGVCMLCFDQDAVYLPFWLSSKYEPVRCSQGCEDVMFKMLIKDEQFQPWMVKLWFQVSIKRNTEIQPLA